MSTEVFSEMSGLANGGTENLTDHSRNLSDEMGHPSNDGLKGKEQGQNKWHDVPDLETTETPATWKDLPAAPTDLPQKRPEGEWKDDFWGDNDANQEDLKAGDSPETAKQNEIKENQPESAEKSIDSQNTDGVQGDELQEIKEEYIDDIIENSEVPETIDKEKAMSADFEKCSVEETAEKRDEFDRVKNTLIEEWEKKTGQKWPTYKEDIYSSNGRLIRHAGDKYDAHHIQPLSMGGKNEADNITPLHAESHYDRQGIHSPDSAYAKLEEKLGA